MKWCYTDINQNPNSPLIYLIHGYTSTKEFILKAFEKFKNYGFSICACDSIGHNGRDGNINDFTKILNEHELIINSYKKNTIIIGHSLGGMIGIGLSKLKYVKKVFVISSPFDISVLQEPNFFQSFFRELSDIFNPNRKYSTEELFDKMAPIFPVNQELSKNSTKKIYLIYSKHDYYVPIEQMYELKNKFNIPKENYKVISFSDHNSIIFRRNVFNWIKRKIHDDNLLSEIILSVSHEQLSNCVDITHAEFLAEPFAERIMYYLNKNNLKIKIHLIKSDDYCYETPNFINQYNELLSNVTKNSIILDIHSKETIKYGLNYELLIYELDNFPCDNYFTSKLSQFLRGNKIIVPPAIPRNKLSGIITSALTNYQLKNSSEIAINESLSINRINIIAKKIAEFIISHLT